MNSLDSLTQLLIEGLPSTSDKAGIAEQTVAAIAGIFGERYHAKSPYAKRVVFMPKDDNVSFAGLLHQDSPNSGVYGGTSLIWFPAPADESGASASLLTLVCGTRGLSPDEHILGRPGHLRHLRSLQRYLKSKIGLSSWVKHSPADLGEAFPRIHHSTYSRFESALKKYGNHIYFALEIPKEFDEARTAFSGLLDLYAWERNWTPLKACLPEIEQFRAELRTFLFPHAEDSDIYSLLLQRRFVILQGPPGTGKTRMSSHILSHYFRGNGFTVQFHPAVTYESFVAGISPLVGNESLNFEVKPGWLAQALAECGSEPFLLCIDEINRADLSRVLGEAIYLFEASEIAEGKSRVIKLPHALKSGQTTISIPSNLYILGTMNSADRSIAIMDLAVRRRFGFVDVWPSLDVVSAQNIDLATEAFSRLQDIFVQYSTQDSFSLLPGHSYFLANSEAELAVRFKFELLPLLNEYLQEGRLSGCETELRAYMDWLSGEI